MTLEQYLALPHAVADVGMGMNTVEDLAIRHDGLKVTITVSYGGFSALPLLLIGTPMIVTVQRRLARFLEPHLPIKLLTPPLSLAPIQESLFWHERHEFEPGHKWLRNLMIEVAKTF